MICCYSSFSSCSYFSCFIVTAYKRQRRLKMKSSFLYPATQCCSCLRFRVFWSGLGLRHYILWCCSPIVPPWWLKRLRICLQCRRPGFSPWVWKVPRRRNWQPTPAPLPGNSHGRRNLAGYSSWDYKELDSIDWLSLFTFSPVHTVCCRPMSFEMLWLGSNFVW